MKRITFFTGPNSHILLIIMITNHHRPIPHPTHRTALWTREYSMTYCVFSFSFSVICFSSVIEKQLDKQLHVTFWAKLNIFWFDWLIITYIFRNLGLRQDAQALDSHYEWHNDHETSKCGVIYCCNNFASGIFWHMYKNMLMMVKHF